ncbi:hypothetical protein [Sphingorhabdus sp.]|uniref:hypothetical protein n=1 Tax=Sphingorhabdus sp. TaxID=1902408 RepID=UPI0035B30D93|nr:hypothetical protein [Sphingomonadaceae bacterium]
MSTDTLVLILYGCGMFAMWLSEDRDRGSDGFYAFMLFFFGPLSLLFVFATQPQGERKLARLTLTRLVLSTLYALACLQWLMGVDELW